MDSLKILALSLVDAYIHGRPVCVSVGRAYLNTTHKRTVSLLVSLPHTPKGLSFIGSNRHCVVGRDPRAPANKNEIN